MTDIPRRYADDPDAYVEPIVERANPDNEDPAPTVDWSSPTVKARKDGTDVSITCTWLGSAAPTRSLRVPVDALPVGIHTLRLTVPNENDIPLGRVAIVAV